VWLHYNCSKLFEIGLRGNLPSLLQSFFYDRSIRVRIQNIYCSHYFIQNGVPQGEVWSAPFFLIATNDLINCITFPLTRRLFADDFSVPLASFNPKRAALLLHLTNNKISSWSSARRFRFSDKKIVLVILRKIHSRSPSPPPLLHFQNFQITLQLFTKFLGLTFHSNTSWIPLIEILKAS